MSGRELSVRLHVSLASAVMFVQVDSSSLTFSETPEIVNSSSKPSVDKKIVDEDGNMIAAVIAGVGTWNDLDIDMIWVVEPYRNKGIGSRLLAEVEKEGKENGAYFSAINVFDWEASLFKKHGYSACVTIEDFPREGHRTYELEKRFSE